MSVLERKDLTS